MKEKNKMKIEKKKFHKKKKTFEMIQIQINQALKKITSMRANFMSKNQTHDIKCQCF